MTGVYERTPEHRQKMRTSLARYFNLPPEQRQRFGMSDKRALTRTQIPSLMDITWAAGIYEGEGCCAAVKTKTGSTQMVVVVQKDTWLLERLKILFGGNWCTRSSGCSVWQITGSRARGFGMTIYKFLSPRRQEQLKVKGVVGYGQCQDIRL